MLAAVDAHLKDQAHDETKVARWIDGILETCMQDLAQLSKPFKYMGKWFAVGLPRRCASLTLGSRPCPVVTVAIMQKNGAGVHTTHSCFWDTVTDGALTVKWPGDKAKDQNKTMYCIVSVYGLSF